jgi:hypothetical protein
MVELALDHLRRHFGVEEIQPTEFPYADLEMRTLTPRVIHAEKGTPMDNPPSVGACTRWEWAHPFNRWEVVGKMKLRDKPLGFWEYVWERD